MALNTLVANKSGVVRHEQLKGVDYTVVPCIAITEGVHNGSGGALYYPAEELAKTPAVWNTKPVVIYHPREGSACDQTVLETSGIGMLMNTRWEPAKNDKDVGKLHTEAWCETNRLGAVDKRVEEAVENSTVMELSTGLFTDNEEKAGDFNGKTYSAIARNYRPDHLALLPDIKGACSVEDGAGFLRLNSAGQPMPRYLMNNAAEAISERFTAEKLSFDTIHRMVSNAVRQANKVADKDNYYPYVEDLFRTHVVFNGKGNRLLRQDYNITNGIVNLVGTPVEVVRVIEYQSTGTPPVGNAQKTESHAMDKKQMVDGLIANKHWKETDREFLMTLPDERVAAIHNMIPPAADAEAEKKKKDKEEADAAAAKKNAAAPAPAQITLDQLPPEMRAVYNHGAAVLTAERDALIGTITANTANEFTAAQLQAMELPTLKAMARLAATTAPPPRYDGQGQPAPVGNAGGAYKEEPLMTPTINWDTAKA